MKYILLILVCSEAIYEGLYDRGWTKPVYWKALNILKTLSKFVQVFFIVTFFYFAFKCSQDWENKYIAIYLLFRISLFNYIYALASGGKLFGRNVYDMVILFVTNRQLWLYILITLVCLIIALGL